MEGLKLPTCPDCKDCDLVPMRTMNRAGEYAPEKRLGCPSCGEGFVGTDEQVAAVERAERAYERRMDGVDKALERGRRNMEQKAAYEVAMRDGLGPQK